MKKIIFMCLFFILNFSIMGVETLKPENEKNLEMNIPEISKFKVFHTISEVNERFNQAQTVVNKHAEAIRQNITKNKELEKRLGNNESATSQINNSVGDLNNQISEMKNNISNNKKQINNLKDDVNTNFKKMGVRIETLQGIVGLNDQVIAEDRTAREEADKKLNSAIMNEKNTREKITAQLSSDINEEKNARKTLEQNIEKNKTQIKNNSQNISNNKNDIADNKENIKLNHSLISENKNDIKNNSERITKNENNIRKISNIQEQTNSHEKIITDHEKRINSQEAEIMKNRARLDEINERVSELDNKVNRGISLMAAMNAVDFQDIKPGEIGIGTGAGHFKNSEGVAMGIAFAPNENIKINAKYSVSTDDIKTSAVGIGGTVKFKIR